MSTNAWTNISFPSKYDSLYYEYNETPTYLKINKFWGILHLDIDK